MKLRKYTLEQLQDSVKQSDSLRECLLRLGVSPYGGNYDTLRKAIQIFNIDISHFTGKAASGRKNIGKKRRIPLKDLLVEHSNYQSNSLRLRLLEEGIFPHQCSKCKGTEWFGELIPLELDHIDGDNTNNLLSNLRLLCPNCHALTPTYRGRNKKYQSDNRSSNRSLSSKTAGFTGAIGRFGNE